MPYATLQDLTDRFGLDMLVRLTDRATPPTGSVDQAVIDQALEDTDAIIDGYASVKYALPMQAVPPLIATVALDIAIYKLHVYSPEEKIAEDYKAAMRTLEHIAAGRVRLPVAGIETPSSGGSGARVTDRERPFTETKLKGFI